MITIQGKVAPIEKQILNKLDNGIKDVELQMLYGISNEDILYLISKYNDLNVYQVHPYINNDCAEVNIKNLMNSKYISIFEDCCFVANEIAKRRYHRVGVILHNNISKEELRDFKCIREYIINILIYLYNLYPNIYICLENVTPMLPNLNTENGLFPEDLKYVCETLNSHGIPSFITIDTCHALMTEKYFNFVLEDNDMSKCDIFTPKKYSLYDWFKICGDYVKSIHLSTLKEFGNFPSNHGIYDESSFKRLLYRYIRPYCEKYCPNVSWTVEVKEYDYSRCINQLAAMKDCRDILKKPLQKFLVYVVDNYEVEAVDEDELKVILHDSTLFKDS